MSAGQQVTPSSGARRNVLPADKTRLTRFLAARRFSREIWQRQLLVVAAHGRRAALTVVSTRWRRRRTSAVINRPPSATPSEREKERHPPTCPRTERLGKGVPRTGLSLDLLALAGFTLLYAGTPGLGPLILSILSTLSCCTIIYWAPIFANIRHFTRCLLLSTIKILGS